ncbi:MAG: bifunctional phosphopantothenoylcysteine decarboxylase/phosphopantothenate--cysteine ligase CoaBC [Candidatus Nanopelagicales bacterium]
MTARILLGVSGGIAAYKACTLLRLLREAGHDVRVVPTESALKFVGAPTWEALSGHPVQVEVWQGVDQVPHVSLGRWADLVIVAPATANLLARAAAGLADDLLTNTLLTATCPVLLAPAMHSEMWLNAATQANVATLRSRGVQVVEPAVGRLTGADSGPGRLPEPEDLFALVAATIGSGPLAGRRVVVSAGGTREPIDPVRFLGNRSSGLQGVAIAAEAVRQGADVTLVAAHIGVSVPPGVAVVTVETAADLLDAMREASADADVVVMTAAVADFRPDVAQEGKIKKVDGVDPAPITLVQNPDVLVDLVERRTPGQVIVGFAAETAADDAALVELARTKLARKGCDLLVANDVGQGRVFGHEGTRALVLDGNGAVIADVAGTKADLAVRLLAAVADRLHAS